MELPYDVRAKIAMFCNLPVNCVFQNLNARSLYEVPLMLNREGLDEQVIKMLGLPQGRCDLERVEQMVER